MKTILIFICMFMVSDIAFSQYKTGDHWVSRYLERGGNVWNITGLYSKNPDLRKYRQIRSVKSQPEYWDWAEVVGGLQPIRNQGSCGSCWAFAATAVVESVLAIKGLGFANDLAEQTPVSSCSNSGSCYGGYFTVFDYLRDKGLPWEEMDPYQARNTRCKQGLESAYKIHSWHYLGQGGRSPTVEEIKAAILRYGPIAVDVNGSFGRYSSGIYDNCNSRGTNHMVTIEGWSDSGKYWIMRNSWGSSWGENGRMRIKWHGRNGSRCNNIGRVAAFVILFPEDEYEGSLAGTYGVHL